jgi:hypothetical protein|tara:strand:- start:10 stop:747 length:738 start_codon:yes stop_codon:yes gene_type:complete
MSKNQARKLATNLLSKGVDSITGNSRVEKAVRHIAGKGKTVKGDDVKKFFNEFGERETFKYFGPSRAKRAMKESKAAKKKEASAPIRTPTGTTRARKAAPKDKPKAQIRSETRQGMRERPQESFTTVLGSSAKTGARPDPKGMKEAKRQSNLREPKSEFDSRMGKTSAQGGVEIPARFSTAKDPKMTRDQISEAMKSGTNPESLTAEDLMKAFEKGNTSKKYMGGTIRGGGKAIRGFGKALKRSN